MEYKGRKEIICGPIVRLIPKSILQNHLHLMVQKAARGYSAHQEKLQKKAVDELGKTCWKMFRRNAAHLGQSDWHVSVDEPSDHPFYRGYKKADKGKNAND